LGKKPWAFFVDILRGMLMEGVEAGVRQWVVGGERWSEGGQTANPYFKVSQALRTWTG